MITRFTIGLKKYEVRDIKVKDLYYIMDTEKYEPKTAAVKIIEHLSDCPEKELMRLKPYQINPLFEMIMNELRKKEAPLKTEIVLNGEKYGLIKLDEITIGELADIELIKADAEGDKKAHELLSILYRPIVGRYRKTYILENYDGSKSRIRAEDFLDLDLDTMIGAIFFLTTFTEISTNHMKNHYILEAEKILKETHQDITPKQNKVSHSFGQRFFTRWLGATHLN